MGLKNSPATFQRVMNNILRGLTYKICLVYLDDVIIFGKTLEEHNKNLEEVLKRLAQHGVKLQTDKCELLRPELKYLGHVITPDGIKTNPKKLKAVEEFKILKNVKELKGFLEFTGYYRKFIKNYSNISKPLTSLLKKESECRWSESCDKKITELKHCLLTDPILQYPDLNHEFNLITNASNYALGAVLTQKNK